MSATSTPARDARGASVEIADFPSDRTRLELLRGGRASCGAPCGADAVVSVVVIAAAPANATGESIRTALAQTHRIAQVLVVGPDWSDHARAVFSAAGGSDARVCLLPVPRPGQAPAAADARTAVRAAQYLRVALPFAIGDWITVCGEPTALAPNFVAERLTQLARTQAELAWERDDAPASGSPFAGALWAAPLAALAPDERAGWNGAPVDAAWWARLLAAGVRTPGTEAPR